MNKSMELFSNHLGLGNKELETLNVLLDLQDEGEFEFVEPNEIDQRMKRSTIDDLKTLKERKLILEISLITIGDTVDCYTFWKANFNCFEFNSISILKLEGGKPEVIYQDNSPLSRTFYSSDETQLPC